MKRPKKRKSVAIFVMEGLFVLAIASPAFAKEIWVLPTHLVPSIPPSLNLIWPATAAGIAVFGFAVPDDMDAFGSARVVLLPTATAAGTYSVFAEIKRDGEIVSATDIGAQQNVPLSLAANTITEVDVSMVLASALDETSGGSDYVSLLFYSPGNLLNVAQVLGVRFVYDAVPVMTADIADGAVTSAKVADDSLTSADIQDGSGSGLDADSLDGLDSGAFAAALHAHDDRYYTETELSTSGAGGQVHWDNLTNVPTGFADGIDDDTTYTAGAGLRLNGTQFSLTSADVTSTPSANTLTTLDSGVRVHSSVTIGADGLGLISYRRDKDPGAGLSVAHCENPECTSSTLTTVDQSADVGDYNSIIIGSDGLGLISYYDAANGDLKVAHCDDIACTTATHSAVDTSGDVGVWTSVTIGSDGLGLISYYRVSSSELAVAHCGNLACDSGNSLVTVDTAGNVGRFSSVAIGADGLAVISYFDDTLTALKVAHCENVECSIFSTAFADDTGGSNVGKFSSVTIGADGMPLVSYWQDFFNDLKVVHCGDVRCFAGNTITVLDSASTVGFGISVTVGADGRGFISYRDTATAALKVAHCIDLECTSAGLVTVDGPGVGDFSAVTIGADGLPLISYYDNDNVALKVAHCSSAFCVPFFRRR